MKDLRITNQEIMNIVEKNDSTNMEHYDAVKEIEHDAFINTTDVLKKTQHYWNKSNWETFCKEVKKLIK